MNPNYQSIVESTLYLARTIVILSTQQYLLIVRMTLGVVGFYLWLRVPSAHSQCSIL